MAKKRKGLREPWKYLRELSVVVAGIAITFLVSDCIGARNQRRDVRRNLAAVELEMKSNLETVREHMEFYTRNADLSNYLVSDVKENLSADSIALYEDVIRYHFIVTFKTSAFEMMKTSGVMRLVKDRLLMQSIIESYAIMEEAKVVSDIYMNRKLQEVYNEIIYRHLDFSEIDLLDPRYENMYHFFSIHINMEDKFRTCFEQMERTLAMF